MVVKHTPASATAGRAASMLLQYWEDASDAYRPGEGSLLPLWKFASEKAKRRQVCDWESRAE